MIFLKIHILELGLQLLVFSDVARNRTSPGLWDAFKDWFYLLLEHEYFWEAQRILHSLFHGISLPQCEVLVNDFIKIAVSKNIGQESVQIAVSCLVQRLVYVVESKCSDPWAVVQWNDAIHWALFGVTLARAGEESVSLFSRICLRPSLQNDFGLHFPLPLYGVRGNDDMSHLLLYAVGKGDLSVFGQAIIAESDTLDDLKGVVLLKAVRLDTDVRVTGFLNSRIVNAQDGYQRAPLHWACLEGQLQAVKLLLRDGKADTGLLDWFGCTPLQYAVSQKNQEIMDLVLQYDSTIETGTQRTSSPFRSSNDEGPSKGNHRQFSPHGSSPDGIGLGVLYPPAGTGDDDAIVDIVFVHGLGGSRYGTWKKNGSLWPQTILAQDFPEARIMTVSRSFYYVPMHF